MVFLLIIRDWALKKICFGDINLNYLMETLSIKAI